MAFALRHQPVAWTIVAVVACTSLACGDDEDGETQTAPGTTTATVTSSSTDDGSTSDPNDSTGAASSGGPPTSESSDEGSTGGGASDPSYPPPDDGNCPGGTTPVTLPGAELCAPACTGADDMSCPAAASGDAPAECVPFLGRGGSGTPCNAMMPCGPGEACSGEEVCTEVAFWACQLSCGAGATCPDGMSCTGFGTCGY